MGIKIITQNKKARFNFQVIETFEAGIALRGSEVKSLRLGNCNLKDSYIAFYEDEAFLQNAHINIYEASSYNNHKPERLRKVLLHRKELDRIFSKIREKGYSCFPLKIYFKKGIVKVEIGLGKGKKSFDKRESIKKRDVDREISRSMKKNRS